jgi:hypothetical protein
MYGSSLLRCFSLFKFIFVEHIIKRRSLKNTIGRIKIHERTPTRYREISTQTSPDDIFTGATLRVYERTPAFSRNVSTRSSNNGLCACITSRNSQCSSGSMSDSSMVNKSMKNERTPLSSRNTTTQTSDSELSSRTTSQISQCSSEYMSDSDSSNKSVEKNKRDISTSPANKQNKV